MHVVIYVCFIVSGFGLQMPRSGRGLGSNLYTMWSSFWHYGLFCYYLDNVSRSIVTVRYDRYYTVVTYAICDIIGLAQYAYVCESHADPALRRISKPTPDPIYQTYAVGDSDSDNEITRVAAVSGLKLEQNLAPAYTFDRGTSGVESGDIRHGKSVTTAGEGGTKSATRGCKPANTDDTGTDVALFPRWTAPTAKAASTTATRLDRRGLFLMWKVRSYSDTLPQLE